MSGFRSAADRALVDAELLDDPCPCPSLLRAAFEARMQEWVFVAQGKAKPIAGDGSAHLKPGAKPPTGADRDEVADVERIRLSFGSALTNRQRLRALKELQEIVLAAKYGPAPARVRGTLDWKIAVASDTRSSFVVARAYDVSSSYVRKLRKAKREGRLSVE